MAETGKGDSKGRGAKSRQGATSETGDERQGGAITQKTFEALMCQSLGALKTLSKHLLPPTGIDIRYPAFAMMVLSDASTPPIAKAAAAAILDICYPEWRSKVKPEIVGPAVGRNDPLVAKWRREVLDRDNQTCQSCGSTENLHAHHILRWVDNPEARLIVSNGITYCGACHKTVPMGGLCG